MSIVKYFVSVPNELIESARMDGASDGRIFLNIMLPIAKPVILTLAIFSVQWRWNDYIWPLIVLNKPKNYTLQVAIRGLVGAENINWTVLLGASVISIIPLLFLFVVFQCYIIDSEGTDSIIIEAFKNRRNEDAWNFMRFLFCYRGLEANKS